MGKRELVALLSLSSWCLVMVVWLYLAVPWVFLRFVIMVIPDHTHVLFLEFVSLKGGCKGSSESTLVKMPHCWKLHVAAQILTEYLMPRLDSPCLHTQCRYS